MESERVRAVGARVPTPLQTGARRLTAALSPTPVRPSLTGRTPAMAQREFLQVESLPPIVHEPEETTDPDSDKLSA